MVRIATFNAENLFARYRFRENFNPTAEGGFGINDTAFEVHDEADKRITAQAIRAVNADILCLQEVENLAVLERFNSRMLGGMGYDHRLVVDSHDPRMIDVAILSRHPIAYVNTHRHERNAANTTWLFSRDCLEVDIDVDGTPLSLYVNHLKSMMGGRAQTHARRREQAERVNEIVDHWWSGSGEKHNFIVLGDMNDYPQGDTALASLLANPLLVSVIDRLPAADHWTHFWAGGNEYHQLDYLLVSKALADRNKTARPKIMRKGLPHRATKYAGERFPEVGHDNPKASDHAPMAMDLKLV